MESTIFLIKNGADLNSLEGSNCALLWEAAREKKLQYVKVFLIYGADPNLKSNNVTPTYEAKIKDILI